MNTKESAHVVVRDINTDDIVLEFDTDASAISAINPEHYRQEKVQCIDAMRFFLGDITVAHGCLFNIFKYLWRYADKNGAEDIGKAQWYMQELKRIINANDEMILDSVPFNMNLILGDSNDSCCGEKKEK